MFPVFSLLKLHNYVYYNYCQKKIEIKIIYSLTGCLTLFFLGTLKGNNRNPITNGININYKKL